MSKKIFYNEIHVNKIPPAIELVVGDYYIVKYVFNGIKGPKITKRLYDVLDFVTDGCRCMLIFLKKTSSSSSMYKVDITDTAHVLIKYII